MGSQHRAATFDCRSKSCGDAAGSHVADQSVDRRLPLGTVNFLCNAVVSNDACVALGQRYEDQYARAVPGMGDTAYNELLKRGPVCAGALHSAGTSANRNGIHEKTSPATINTAI